MRIIKKAVLFLMVAFSALGFQQLAFADSNDFSAIPNENVQYNLHANTATTNQNRIINYSIADFEKAVIGVGNYM